MEIIARSKETKRQRLFAYTIHENEKKQDQTEVRGRSASTEEERRGIGVYAPEPTNRTLKETPQARPWTLPSIEPEGEKESYSPRGELPPPLHHTSLTKSTPKIKKCKKITAKLFKDKNVLSLLYTVNTSKL